MRIRTLKAPAGVDIKTTLQSLTASVDVKAIRTETYQGREFLAIPVVALVEGVLQGINSPVPELALAGEFGKYPQGWNGRPVVMNHPDVGGVSVSAGDPGILEVWAFGQMFNTVLDEKKLKTEAWIDVELAKTKGGEFESTLARLQDGTMVEVSVGCFVSTFQAKGIYNGKAYKAVWAGVVPDHLAMLSEGVLGACSIETGCGAPRLNKDASMTTVPAKNTPALAPKPTTLAIAELTGSEDTCHCHDTPTVNEDAAELLEELQAEERTLAAFTRRLAVEALPANLISEDIRQLLSKAVRKAYSYNNVSMGCMERPYLLGYTTDMAVFELYVSGGGYICYQVPFSMDASGKVAFTGDPAEINLIMQIVTVDDPTPNAGITATLSQKENTMTKTAAELAAEAKAPATPTTPAAKPAVATPVPAAAATVTPAPDATVATPVVPSVVPPPTNAAALAAAAAEAAKKPVTVSDYIAAAPAELQEVLNEGIRLQAQKKATLIAALVATKDRCAFDEAELKAMSTTQLEKLVRLADVPDYSGAGGQHQPDPLNVNADGPNGFMAAPVEPLFAPKTVQ